MRSTLVLLFLALMSASALAQREAKFEVEVGIGTDIIHSSTIFKNDHNLSASACYNLTREWGVGLYFSQQTYRLNRLSTQNQGFLGGRTPEISKTVTSLLIAGRYFIPTESKVFIPYVSVAFGSARSVSSAEGYYVERYMYKDTVYYRIESGPFLLGLLSSGLQIRPVSFLNLFAELQIPVASNQDLSPAAIACRIGVGVMF